MKGQLIAAVLVALSLCQNTAGASVLKGGVRMDGSGLRLSRPMNGQATQSQSSDIPVAPPARLMRGNTQTSTLSGNAQSTGLVDPSLFAGKATTDSSAPLSGQAQAANNKFDIGAERGSRTLTLAWEAWHKQLCAEIYARWQDVAMVRGRATMKVTVTADHHVIAQLTDPSGNPVFDRILLKVISSLDGNPGLSFPVGSQRKSVSFEADYIADSNVRGGYSWTHGDYETVNQGY
jgi:hypothetical protein